MWSLHHGTSSDGSDCSVGCQPPKIPRHPKPCAKPKQVCDVFEQQGRDWPGKLIWSIPWINNRGYEMDHQGNP